MVNESEWNQIKKELFDLYEQKKDFSQKEIEKLLQNLLVKKSDGSSLSDKLKATSAKFLLTSRESEVLNELIDGRTNQEISENLSVSLSTVKKHVYNIFNKVGVNSRAQLLNLVYTIEKE